MELGEREIGFKYEKKKNPFWDETPTRHAKILAQALNKFFLEVDKKLTIDAKEHLYSNGFVSVLIYIYKIFLVYLGKAPSSEELGAFTDALSLNFNSLNAEEADEVRKKLTSEANKGDYRNGLVRFLQERYDVNFGLGLFDSEPSMFEKIRDLELSFNKFIYFYLVEKLDDDWFEKEEYFSNTEKKFQYKKRMKKEGYEIWEVLDLNVIVDVVTKKNLWDVQFKAMFAKYGLKSPEQLKIQTSMMMDYRSSSAHKRETVKVVPKEEMDLINLTYKMLTNLLKKES